MKQERPALAPAALIAASLFCFALSRCATAPPTEAPPDPETGKKALVAADEAFSRMAQERGLAEAFAAFAAPDATMMPVNQDPVTGLDAVRKQFAGTPAGTALAWKPFRADISKSGDLGYTLGTYELKTRGPEGAPVTRYGKYCSVWKKQPDGSWKWVVDIGNSSPEPTR
jgi:ketosteroid isomerase-like protein